jgi:alpha-N-arabinofuranosidase
LEEHYNLEDALVVALQMNAFIRHAKSVKMANLAQIVNVIAPILTSPQGLVLQPIFFPFEAYSQQAGPTALDVAWSGDTFQGGDIAGVRVLDVAATVDAVARRIALFVVNRSLTAPAETRIVLQEGTFGDEGLATIIAGSDPKATNTFERPDAVQPTTQRVSLAGKELRYTFAPLSVTTLTLPLR